LIEICAILFDFYLSRVVCFVDKVKVDLNFSELKDKKEDDSKHDQLSLDVKNLNLNDGVSPDGKVAQTFTFAELAAATQNFREDCFVGEGGFGKVYKGYLEKINQVCYKFQCHTFMFFVTGFMLICTF
jgi:hypothetical protein